MIAAVIFDMDGTLVDSEPVWEVVRRGLVTDLGGRWSPGTQARLMGMSTREWARYLTDIQGVAMDPEAFADLVIARIGEAYAHDLPLLPGAAEAVRRMSDRWPVAVASSSPASTIHLVIERAGLSDVFSAVAASDEVPRGKPAPDVYWLAAERLGIQPSDAVAVEDSSNGMRSAAAAGMRVIAIPRPEYPPDPDALGQAHLRLDNLSQLTVAAVAALDGQAGPPTHAGPFEG